MPENKNNPQNTEHANGEPSVYTICPVADLKDATHGTVCAVCGHINKGQSLICEMCSNYLFD